MRKYDSYKDSGIEWIGEIPEHWDSVSLKWIASIYSGGTPSKNKPEYWNDGTIPWLNSGEVNQGNIREASEYITEEALSDSSAKWIPEKSLVMALAGQGKTKGMVAQVQFRTTCNQSLGVIVPNKKIDNRFLMYWLRKNYQNIRNLGGGDKRDGINLEMIGSIKTPITTPEEQTAIANFLDRKTAEIDELIADKKRLLELYEEEKTAIINQAVTKGINPNVPMEDSGIEWLGEIPEHWEVKRIRHVAQIFGRIGYRGYKTTDLVPKGEGAITISPSNMKAYHMEYENCTYLSWEKYEESPEIMIYNDDILFVKTGSTYGKVSFVENLPEKATINPQIIVLKQITCINKYLWYVLKSSNIIYQVERTVVGGTIPTISQAKINNYEFPIPSDEEQTEIVNFIDNETNRVEKLINKTEKLIDLLTEYRTALISEVVTGKIKVI
ncbi:restriction endonuclease subunit S [Xanthomarina sp.]|uniref:restriction endonuclease subunit S n=1 Tax=Xanthomarina sp. TaxID=1931211 RepID=UPI002BAA0586|nr:restriction endonuclease subunit S [Xanthomarina sp.]HLV39357.1 restriction endonuclease subunit S [Xanthomarina sp.]